MRVKEILIGFFVALLATLGGLFLYIYFFSDYGELKTIQFAIQKGVMGNLIALGSIGVFLPFFVFLKKNQLFRIRGVILCVILAALFIAYFEIR